MKKTGFIALVLLAVMLILAVYFWFSVWNKPQLNVADAQSIKIDAAALFRAYSANEQAANTTYLEKVVEVSGVVTSVTKNAEGLIVVLLKTDDPMFGINCTMEQKDIEPKEGDTVTLKGICTGYLTDVVLIRCSFLK